MSFIAKPLTEEEIELNDAMDVAIEARDDAGKVMGVGLILNIIGFPLFIISERGSRPERLGSALILCSLLCLAIHFILMARFKRKWHSAHKLVNEYRRKKAIPFFNELTEMFADKNVHVHLNDDGVITVTDNRNKEENRG